MSYFSDLAIRLKESEIDITKLPPCSICGSRQDVLDCARWASVKVCCSNPNCESFGKEHWVTPKEGS